jgi:hypothetical protein
MKSNQIPLKSLHFPKNGKRPKIQTIGGPQLLPFLPLPPFSNKKHPELWLASEASNMFSSSKTPQMALLFPWEFLKDRRYDYPSTLGHKIWDRFGTDLGSTNIPGHRAERVKVVAVFFSHFTKETRGVV